MMKFKNDSEVLKVLGIDAWDQITSTHLPQLISIFPEVDKEVALSILPQLVGSIPTESLATLREAVAANDRSQDRQHDVDLKSLDIYAAALTQAESPEERAEIRNDIREVRQDKLKKDTENKEFLQDIAYKVLGFVAVGLIGGLIVAGAVNAKKV